MSKPKLGIALGGGAARGWAHIGVLKTLISAGFEPDVIVGTSIGAVAGGCCAVGKNDQLEDFARSLNRRRVFNFLDFNLAGSGLITGQRLCDKLDSHLDSYRIEDLSKGFAAIATELGTGHEVWLKRGRLVDAMHASYAMPGIFRPVKIGGRWLIDGALVNPISVSVCRALGAQAVIAVNLNSDVYGKGGVIYDHGSSTELTVAEESSADEPRSNGRAALHLLHRQFFGRGDGAPGISTVMVEAFNITQDRIARARLAGDPPDLMIAPQLSSIGLFDFHKADIAIPAGVDTTEQMLDQVDRLVSAMAA